MKISHQPRGTQILIGDDADRFARTCEAFALFAAGLGARRVILPAIDGAECYVGKPGERMLVNGPSRATVLCPERTDQVRRLFREHRVTFPVFYIERCYRLERPQFGRWREFTQFGVEWPKSVPHDPDMIVMKMHDLFVGLGVNGAMAYAGVDRGLDYYTGGTFEIHADAGDKRLQIAGGGDYPEGTGFAFGVDRVIACARAQEAAR